MKYLRSLMVLSLCFVLVNCGKSSSKKNETPPETQKVGGETGGEDAAGKTTGDGSGNTAQVPSLSPIGKWYLVDSSGLPREGVSFVMTIYEDTLFISLTCTDDQGNVFGPFKVKQPVISIGEKELDLGASTESAGEGTCTLLPFNAGKIIMDLNYSEMSLRYTGEEAIDFRRLN